ncbi:MAG: exo-alpha-sialidase [Christensenellaceae bacterium]|nr:exo-alpha-sialidase [Christensenellaceae bacterium]
MDDRGKVVLELIPKKGNPRNSEGAFLPVKDGIMFVYSSFYGDMARDHTPADISVIYSYDGANTFTEPKTLFKAEDFDAMNMMSLSLLRLKNGDIALFFLMRISFYDMQPCVAISKDEGKTFSAPKVCTSRKSYFVINNDRVIRLPSGRILVPLAEHVALAPSDGVPAFHPGTLTYVYSDDECETFHETKTPLSLINPHTKSGLQEPGCISLGGKYVYSWARTDLGCQYEMFSRDEGTTWSTPQPSIFTSPLSPLSMKRLPDGKLFAIWNPIPSYQTRYVDPKTGGRTPLVYALSDDEGLTWSEPVILEDDPLSGYCYTAVCVYNDSILLSYCSGNVSEHKSCLNMTRIRKIPLDSVTHSEKIHSPEGAMGIGLKDEY